MIWPICSSPVWADEDVFVGAHGVQNAKDESAWVPARRRRRLGRRWLWSGRGAERDRIAHPVVQNEPDVQVAAVVLTDLDAYDLAAVDAVPLLSATAATSARARRRRRNVPRGGAEPCPISLRRLPGPSDRRRTRNPPCWLASCPIAGGQPHRGRRADVQQLGGETVHARGNALSLSSDRTCESCSVRSVGLI